MTLSSAHHRHVGVLGEAAAAEALDERRVVQLGHLVARRRILLALDLLRERARRHRALVGRLVLGRGDRHGRRFLEVRARVEEALVQVGADEARAVLLARARVARDQRLVLHRRHAECAPRLEQRRHAAHRERAARLAALVGRASLDPQLAHLVVARREHRLQRRVGEDRVAH
eukprot:789980-Prymnesium_polylepis.1